jgi:hypothetical protein
MYFTTGGRKTQSGLYQTHTDGEKEFLRADKTGPELTQLFMWRNFTANKSPEPSAYGCFKQR